MTSADVGKVARTKREIYNILAVDAQVYLPPYDNTTIYFMDEIMKGKKKKLNNKSIMNVYIP